MPRLRRGSCRRPRYGKSRRDRAALPGRGGAQASRRSARGGSDVRRAEPRRVGGAVVGHALRLPLGRHPRQVVLAPRGRCARRPSRGRRPSARRPAAPTRRRGARSRSRPGSAGSARRPGAGRPRRAPRTRPRRRGIPGAPVSGRAQRRVGPGEIEDVGDPVAVALAAGARSSPPAARTPAAISARSRHLGPPAGADAAAGRRSATGMHRGQAAGRRAVDDVGGHDPVGRVLAAGHQQQAEHRGSTTACSRDSSAGRVGLAGQQRAQPGVHALDVVGGQRPVEHRVDLVEQVGDVARRRRPGGRGPAASRCRWCR